MDNVKTVRRFPAGVVTPPPSKSLSHRAVICAALAAVRGGESRIENLGWSEDIRATLSAVKELGVDFHRDASGVSVKKSSGTETGVADCAESGSTLRFMLPVMAALGKTVLFTGRGRLLDRPMGVYEEELGKKGVAISRSAGGIGISGQLRGGIFELPGDVSSQFVSGLLLALPLLDGDSVIKLASPLESSAYVDMTVDVMKRFGVAVDYREGAYHVTGGRSYSPFGYTVEADFSQAAFFLAAAALGCDVSCAGLKTDSIQGDRAILDILRGMGADIALKDDIISVGAAALKPVTVDMREIPDLAPPVAALMCFCEGESRMINAGRLRYKESDRLHALASELGRLGADIREEPDSLTVKGLRSLNGGRADAHGDHRIAMALAVAAIRCTGEVEITGADSVSKSYPLFWEDFEKSGRER